MRSDDLIRGFGEVEEELVQEMIQVQKEGARQIRRKRGKIMKIAGIAAACTAAAALLGVTLLPGILRPKQLGTPLQTVQNSSDTGISEAEEFSSAITPTNDMEVVKEIEYDGKIYRFAGFIEKPGGLVPVPAEKRGNLDGTLVMYSYEESGVKEIPVTPVAYRVEGNDSVLVLEHMSAWYLYRMDEHSNEDSAEPALEAPENTIAETADDSENAGEGFSDGSVQGQESDDEGTEENNSRVIADTMQLLDDAQLIYSQEDGEGKVRVKVRPITSLTEQKEEDAVDWVLPAEGESLGAEIAKAGDALYFVRRGAGQSRICRKSFTTQEEEVLLTVEGEAWLLAVCEEKILYGIGSDVYEKHVYLYDTASGTSADLGDRGKAVVYTVMGPDETADGMTNFTIGSSTHDVSAQRLWIIREDGEVLLQKWSFSCGVDKEDPAGACLYYRDDASPAEGMSSVSEISVRRYRYADGSDEAVYRKSGIRSYFEIQNRGSLLWMFDDKEAWVCRPSLPKEKLAVLPDSNGLILNTDGRYYTYTWADGKVWYLDLERGECREIAQLEGLAGTAVYLSEVLCAEEMDVLVCRAGDYVTGIPLGENRSAEE